MRAEQVLRDILDNAGIDYVYQAGFFTPQSFYIVDFYIKSPYKLIIEIDDTSSKDTKRYDYYKKKIGYLRRCGFRVLRFSNKTVLDDRSKVQRQLFDCMHRIRRGCILKHNLKMKMILFLLVVVFSSSGCATLYNPATGKNELILIDSTQELAIGHSLREKFIRHHPISYNKELQDRLSIVGERISRVSDRKDIDYKFWVLKDKELNALTLPGGFIYVNEGLISIVNDDELSFVVAHEVGHTAARHIVKKLQANLGYQLLLAVALAGISGNTQQSTIDILRGIDTIYNLIELRYSRHDEYEADRLAVKYMFYAGYNPSASISCLEKIKQSEGPNWKILSYFRTHPYVNERIKALETIIPKLNN
ncbi:MAG: M48 family metalloprotease [Candidatus Omnitrophica bacterium]|nr:M48 family metalloprotease [Candidatus Omnitrophota bacterium]